MAVELVTRYQTEDGALFESREDAERHEAAKQIDRMLNGKVAATSAWIAAHLRELSIIYQYPVLAKQTVDEYMGIKDEPIPEEPEEVAA